MTHMIVLLCMLGVPPEECDASKAVRSIPGPAYGQEAVCNIHSVWFARDSDVKRDAERIHPLSYVKLVCVQGAVA